MSFQKENHSLLFDYTKGFFFFFIWFIYSDIKLSSLMSQLGISISLSLFSFSFLSGEWLTWKMEELFDFNWKWLSLSFSQESFILNF